MCHFIYSKRFPQLKVLIKNRSRFFIIMINMLTKWKWIRRISIVFGKTRWLSYFKRNRDSSIKKTLYKMPQILESFSTWWWGSWPQKLWLVTWNSHHQPRFVFFFRSFQIALAFFFARFFLAASIRHHIYYVHSLVFYLRPMSQLNSIWITHEKRNHLLSTHSPHFHLFVPPICGHTNCEMIKYY